MFINFALFMPSLNRLFSAFHRYISSISFFSRAAITSRFNFPFAVSRPFSIEKGSGIMRKARIACNAASPC